VYLTVQKNVHINKLYDCELLNSDIIKFFSTLIRDRDVCVSEVGSSLLSDTSG
jgi:hypothetical protein